MEPTWTNQDCKRPNEAEFSQVEPDARSAGGQVGAQGRRQIAEDPMGRRGATRLALLTDGASSPRQEHFYHLSVL